METPLYLTFNQYLRNQFGERVQRVALHGGSTCPNRDGTRGRGGCIYCDNRTFNPWSDNNIPLAEQLQTGMARAQKRYGARLFLAYFQTYSNTYAPVETLKPLFYEAIAPESVVGLMVSTRPDCINGDVLTLLQEISEKMLVWVEIGIQTIWDETLKTLNRCHTHAESADAITRVREAGLPVAAHVILGLPGETQKMMLKTADALADLNVEGLKLHHLHAVKNTPLEILYESGRWQPQTVNAYIDTAAKFIHRMPGDTVIMRLSGDCPDHLLVAPRWKLSKSEIQKRIEGRLRALQ